ncbi:MAG: CopG family ribbon-helix-helix protein [Bauldia sp.]
MKVAHSTETRLTIHLDPIDMDRLTELARHLGRTAEDLAASAIRERLDLNDADVAGIKAAIEQIERGESISGEAVQAWLESWGTDHELPPPKPGQ